MIQLKLTVTIKLNEKGREFYKGKSEFIESKTHDVRSIDLLYEMITIPDESGCSVETIFTEYCENLNVEQ
ncbi:hypothetical protein [uncultured Chryseobacterium sp.]|uniref:hypothetical protein n=1 Tax=uncultured Chryseobacterium sp. TaxID=259322 RepID=UPI0025ED5275|nr:hypothetical protein [uncultured Chryseobacterium sp.]